MQKKANTSVRPLGNDINAITWYEFWHPRKAAALAAEQDYNDRVFDENANQDDLEADMTYKLSLMEKEFEEKKLETIKMITITVVFAVVAFVLVKYV